MDDILVSFLLAAVGAAIASVVGWCRRALRDRQLRRKFPVGGRFITEYEDRSGAGCIKMKGRCTLRQKGRYVSGDNSDVKNGRTWSLRGAIEPGGFLNGVYRAADPHDSGIGTFFLKVDGVGGDMHGLWGGYDSENGFVTSGSYVFRRRPDTTIRPARSDEAPRVLALLGDALGEFYVDLATVREAIAGEDGSTCLVAVNAEGRLIGVATYYLVSQDSFARFLPIGQEAVAQRLRVLRFNESVGLLRSIAVRSAYRGRGVATELTEAGIQWCDAQGATAMLAAAWCPPTGSRLRGVMELTGFEPIEEIDSYWTEDSQAKDYICPVCGDVCQCSSVIYSRPLDGGQAIVQVAPQVVEGASPGQGDLRDG